MSLDGYIEDEHGAIDMGPLDDDLYPSYTDLLGSTGTFLYGRRLDEAMAVWETTPPLARSPTTRPTSRQPGKRRTKSSTREPWPRCQPQGPARTRFDPGSVRDMKASATRDPTVGGAHLAAQAFKAGLVDECRLSIWPVIFGGGKAALSSGDRADLELLDERRFGNGVVQLRYRIPTWVPGRAWKRRVPPKGPMEHEETGG